MNFGKTAFLIFVLMGFTAVLSAQQTYTVTADSTKLTGTDSNELIIENHTQNIKGFLFNKGKGRTVFQKGVIKIDESTYVIGSDTIRTGGGFTDSGTFYVQKRYAGVARAVIAGYTLASVSSTNPSYNSQLSKAVPGNILSCYPDPFSARNAALDLLAAGKIKHAQIVILEGNQYTIGSKDSTRNGSIDGLHPKNGTVSDIQFDSAALVADNGLSSIMKNNVDMHFSMGTNLTYINSTFNIYCIYLNDTTNNALFKSNIYGVGSFYQVYGEVNGFTAAFYSLADRNSYTSFHAKEVILQQFQGFVCKTFSLMEIDIEDLLTADASVFGIGYNGRYNGPIRGNASSPPEMAHIKVKNWKFGKDQIPYPTSNDTWYGIALEENPWQEGVIITYEIGNLYMYSSNYSPLFWIGTSEAQYNVRMTVNIDNLVQRDSHLKYQNNVGGLLNIYNAGVAVNNSITYNIKSARIEAPLLGWMNFSIFPGSKNNRFNINVGDLQKDSSAYTGGLFNVMSQFPGVTDQMVISIKGNFKSYDNKPMISIVNAPGNLPLANKWVFSGTYYMARSGQPVARFYMNPGKVVAFKDAVLLTDAATSCLMADASGTPVYIKNVHANSAPASGVQLIGDAGIALSDVSTFFAW